MSYTRKHASLCLMLTLVVCSSCSLIVRKKISDNGKKQSTAPCVSNKDCDDGLPCNGVEYCAPEAEKKDARGCTYGLMPADGFTCTTGAYASGLEICVSGECVVKRCGDGFTDPNLGAQGPAEECDDGNADDSDGCTKDCKFTCRNDAECALTLPNTDPCKKAPTCDLVTHRCRDGIKLVSASCTVP